MRRVMTVSKGRSVLGLPCSVSVASWTLLLVLLLSSSFSHIQRSGKKATEENITGSNEFFWNAREGVVRSRSPDGSDSFLERGQGSSGDYRSSVQFADASEQDWLDTYSGSKSCDLDDDEGSVSADRSVYSQVLSTSSGSTLDALQYAEYGAGLLQKSGAAEEVTKVCRLSSDGGGSCSGTVTDHSSCTGHESSAHPVKGDFLCTGEVSAEEFCQTVEMVDSHLVCRRITELGTGLPEIACSSMTECFTSGIDSRFCYYDGSLLNLLRPPPEMHRSPGQYRLTCSETAVAHETSQPVSTLASDPESSLIESLEADDESTTLTGYDYDPKATDIPLQQDPYCEADVEVAVEDQVTEVPFLAPSELQEVADEDVGRISSEGNLMDIRNQRLEDSVLLSMNLYTDTDTLGLGSVAEENGGAASPLPNLGIGIVDEVLTEELQHIAHAIDGGPFKDKPLMSTGADNGMQLEPVKLRRVGSVMSLDEYKRSILEKQQKVGNDVNLSVVQTQKLRHSDETYNYAASSHGAKVLSSNKEAKGPSHIISSDKDKYLRNPCSAEEKYVVLELSEETFVDTVVISNFEFHSANLKDFEIFGSPVYPAKEWILMGKFRAENVRHRQKFSVEDPQLVRYIKLRMLTHWGSEFFCTLSAVEVYGVDVIKNLLDDWIAHEEGEAVLRAQMSGSDSSIIPNALEPEALQGLAGSVDPSSPDPPTGESSLEMSTRPDDGSHENREKKPEGSSRDDELNAGVFGSEVHHSAGGKTPGDSVLKLLMQKVKALELSQTLFYNYLEEMNYKYKAMISELDKDLVMMTERVRDEAAVSASLMMRLADMELKRKEERAYLEHRFAMIAINFTENVDFMSLKENLEEATILHGFLLNQTATKERESCRHVRKHQAIWTTLSS
ncbi:hypothetical protein AXG93_2402s1300 [Marchantia polymorpha subsp. ruderalis]|uniref:SUN domain-containing protein n=1 Tax=Marchantia polymorpha subsp. ruderalis TaxID=1480154 RepID=A0A176VUM7_MARPO|nr:hypothetical protein AXG93_2402s1300 [Marchantia polymorpha subsp. ruderalis]